MTRASTAAAKEARVTDSGQIRPLPSATPSATIPPLVPLVSYPDSSDEEEEEENVKGRYQNPSNLSTLISPPVPLPESMNPDTAYASALVQSAGGVRTMTHNVPYAQLAQPIQGPMNPFTKHVGIHAIKNTITGFVEGHAMNHDAFDALQRSWQGPLGLAAKTKAAKKRTKGPKLDPSDPNYMGPWGGADEGVSKKDMVVAEEVVVLEQEENPASEAQIEPSPPAKKAKTSTNLEDGGEASEHLLEQEEDVTAKPARKTKSIFHGKSMRDYQGRTYMHVPTDTGINLLTNDPTTCEYYMPKKLLHTWTGHTKGVTAMKLFPQSAHLLLSCSMDTTIKLWDFYRGRKLLRTFLGHTKGVKGIDFSPNGQRFVSCSFDRTCKVWDTETGVCLADITVPKVPFCVAYHPSSADMFLVGSSDGHVYQYDVRSGNSVVDYKGHTAPVNTIIFVNEGQQFVTSSEDRSLRLWDVGIPAVVKIITDEHMKSMPAVCSSFDGRYIIYSGLDSQIRAFDTTSQLTPTRRVFAGHMVGGYALTPSLSPDGRYLTCGDSKGTLWYWDWKGGRCLRQEDGHRDVVMCVLWHPHETSKVLSCSWDGTIKLWD